MAFSKLREKITISAVLIIVLLALIVIVPSLLYWTIERNDMHARWARQVELAQSFDFYGMEGTEIVLMNTNFTSDSAYRSTGASALESAQFTLNNLVILDFDRANQLYRIETMLLTLAPHWSTYTTGLNQTQRGTLANLLGMIGNDILFAYGNYINYTSSGPNGPPFWYNGPSPPDQNLVQHAVDLAVNLPGLPPLPPSYA
jgi:hypothetical protein